MNRVCENCKYFETSNIDRLSYEEEIIGRYCYKEPIPIILDEDILSCRFFEEVK